MKMLLALSALAGVLAVETATAQTVDISTIKCSDIASMGADEVGFVLTWIDGYMGGQADDTSFDVQRLQSNIDGAVSACSQNPDQTVMDVLHTAENG